MKLLAHHELDGFGGIGEGMALPKNQGWPAHHVDGARIGAEEFHRCRRHRSHQAENGGADECRMPRCGSNSLDVVGDLMVVAYQTQTVGLKPAGIDLFDISVPETPKLISHFRPLRTAFARRACGVVLSTANTCTWPRRARF